MNHLHRFTGIVVAAGLFLTCSASQQIRRHGNSKFKIPFTLTAQNNIVVNAVLNHTDAFDLMLHTATADVRLTEAAVRKSKSIKFTDAAKVESWGGKSDSRFSLGNHLQIGALQWGDIKIWEDKNSGVGTDGKFGLDLFQDRIVEIDFDHQRITVSDRLPSKAAKYQRLKLETTNGDLFVEANCLIDGMAYSNRFLIHSGYSDGLLLDDAFVARTGIDGKIKITEESSLKDSFGNIIQVKKAVLPVLALGNLQLQNVATGFFSGSIGKQKMSVLGGDVLKRFNLIFDISNNTLYLLRNGSSVALK